MLGQWPVIQQKWKTRNVKTWMFQALPYRGQNSMVKTDPPVLFWRSYRPCRSKVGDKIKFEDFQLCASILLVDEVGGQHWYASLTNKVDNSELSQNNNNSYHQLRHKHVLVSTVTGVDGISNQCIGEFRWRILRFWLLTKTDFRMHGGWKDQWKNVSWVQDEIVRGTWPASCWYAVHKLPPTWRQRAWRQWKWAAAFFNKEGEEKEKRKTSCDVNRPFHWIVAASIAP